ncbi:tripartite motif-containing protein 16-like [Lampetra fluviatilis]
MAESVVCGNCGDDQTPAVKTCKTCMLSFCVTHLRPHVENPEFRDHVLMGPTANLAKQQCKIHHMERIIYCEQDKRLVCLLCIVAHKHKGHECNPVQDVQREKQKALRREMTGREEKKTTAESRIEQLRGDYNRVQESLSGTRTRISREFERRRERLRQEETEALECVDEEGRSVLSRIQADIDRYESRAQDLEQEINQLLAALAVKDPFTFLKDPVHNRLRESSVSQETQDDPAPVSRSLNLAKFISVGGVQTKLLPFLDGCSPTLDTTSAHILLLISSDLRTVTCYGVMIVHSHYQRSHYFQYRPQALCSESFSSGQHYWEVDVGGARQCRVGVAYGSIPRRTDDDECCLGGSDVSWCLEKRGSSFSVWHGGVETSLTVPEPPRRVGVHLDWDAGLLSFYNADAMALLHSFHQTFAQPLHPGLGVGHLGFMGRATSYYTFGQSVRIVDLSGAC